MNVRLSPFVRRLLVADAALLAVAGAVLLVDAGLFAPWLGVSEGSLRAGGGALLPVAAALGWFARRNGAPLPA